MKIGEVGNRKQNADEDGATAGTPRESISSKLAAAPSASSISSGIYDALELFFSFRGIGWDFGTGTGLYVPAHTHDTSCRRTFLLQTLRLALMYFLGLDFIHTFIGLLPGIGSPEGGSIFIDFLPPAQRYILATLVTFTFILFNYIYLGLMYEVLAFSAVLVLRHDPSSWPPIFDRPIQRTSLRAYWARGWHNSLRQTFFDLGGFPLERAFGKIGRELGTCLGSGLFHYLVWIAFGKTDWRIFAMFAGQFVGLRIETAWKWWTGHPVGGVPGRIWMWFWLISTSMIFLGEHTSRNRILLPSASNTDDLLIFALSRCNVLCGFWRRHVRSSLH